MITKPWLAQYDSGVPHEISVPAIALPELLAAAARDYPHAPAILFYSSIISYAELDRLVTRFAQALCSAGLQPGDRVALVLPNVPQAVICYYGALRAGATVVLANPLFDASSLTRQLEDAQVTAIVALSMFHPLITTVRARIAFKQVIYTNLKEYLPASQRGLFTLLRQDHEGHLLTQAGLRCDLSEHQPIDRNEHQGRQKADDILVAHERIVRKLDPQKDDDQDESQGGQCERQDQGRQTIHEQRLSR